MQNDELEEARLLFFQLHQSANRAREEMTTIREIVARAQEHAANVVAGNVNAAHANHEVDDADALDNNEGLGIYQFGQLVDTGRPSRLCASQIRHLRKSGRSLNVCV